MKCQQQMIDKRADGLQPGTGDLTAAVDFAYPWLVHVVGLQLIGNTLVYARTDRHQRRCTTEKAGVGLPTFHHCLVFHRFAQRRQIIGHFLNRLADCGNYCRIGNHITMIGLFPAAIRRPTGELYRLQEQFFRHRIRFPFSNRATHFDQLFQFSKLHVAPSSAIPFLSRQ